MSNKTTSLNLISNEFPSLSAATAQPQTTTTSSSSSASASTNNQQNDSKPLAKQQTVKNVNNQQQNQASAKTNSASTPSSSVSTTNSSNKRKEGKKPRHRNRDKEKKASQAQSANTDNNNNKNQSNDAKSTQSANMVKNTLIITNSNTASANAINNINNLNKNDPKAVEVIYSSNEKTAKSKNSNNKMSKSNNTGNSNASSNNNSNLSGSNTNLVKSIDSNEKFVHTVCGGMSKEQFKKIQQNQQHQQQQPIAPLMSIKPSSNNIPSDNMSQRTSNNISNNTNNNDSTDITNAKNRNYSTSSISNMNTNNKSVVVSILNSNLIAMDSSNYNNSSSSNNVNNQMNNNPSNNNSNNNLYNKQFNNNHNSNSTTAINTNNTNKYMNANERDMEFEKNYVYKMKKPSRQNDQAKYRCNICNYFCNNVEVVYKHITGPIHRANLENIRLEIKIRELEMPSINKLECLSSFLIDFYTKNVISKSNLKKRYDIYFEFKKKFLAKHPDAIINMYGSCVYGICFNDSSCDISIEFNDNNLNTNQKSSQQIINEVCDFIKTEMTSHFDPNLFNINAANTKSSTSKAVKQQQQFCLASNKLVIESLESNIVFNFTSGIHSSAHKTSSLLKAYVELDDRVKILALCFRYIARIAQIDKVELCTLPSHSYILMTIYFLQKLNPPVLPVLHEIINSKKLTEMNNLNNNTRKIINNRKHLKSTKSEESECVDKDVEATTKNAAEANKSDSEEACYDYDTIQNFNIFKKNLKQYINSKTWKSLNEDNIGTLWLKLLTFYSVDFGFKKTFISVRRHTRISKSKVKMYSKKIAIEDPFSLKQSLSRNLLTETNKFIITTISKSCLYFVTKTDNCLTSTSANTSKLLTNNAKTKNIVESLINETGIVEARKSNRTLEDDFDESDDDEDDEEDENDSDFDDNDDSFIFGESNDDNDSNEANNLGNSQKYLRKKLTSITSNDIKKKTLRDKKSASEELPLQDDSNVDSLNLKDLSLLEPSRQSSLETVTTSSISTPQEQENLALLNGYENNHDVDIDEDEDVVLGDLDVDDIDDEVLITGTSEEDDTNQLRPIIHLKNRKNSSRKTSKRNDEDNNDIINDDPIKECLNHIIYQIVEDLEFGFECIPHIDLNPLLLFNLDSIASYNKLTNNPIFKFTASSIGFAKGPPKICSLCNKEGHLQNECPQDKLPKLEALPTLTNEWKEVLDKVCLTIMDDNVQTKKEESDRNTLFNQIKKIVTRKFPEAKLSLFGSSNNGFAMKKSDLDICMTLDGYPDKEKSSLNFKKIIRSIGALFRYEHEFDMIEERVSAKVPIVKFRHKKTNIEGDISLYNTLALQNTDLLRSYAEIDSRTKVLGHMVKYFAKVCRIGDASCGSLSSYAYIVMMIHYLMNTSPPVLPCLQKLNRENLSKKETSLNIDGWDCWFNRDLTNLKTLWPHFSKNTQSVGELWLGFLRYYTELFDWDNNVVCIRDNSVLTRKTKNWIKHRMAIEDPFELTHNLAAGVSPKMGLYILKSFAKARSLFGNVIIDFKANEIRFNIDYFFNPKSLVEGNPPMDRNCFSCMKIGHQTKDCHLTKRKEKQQQMEGNQLNNNENDMLINLQCFKCRGYGHKAKDCPISSESKRQKTVSTSNMSKCFNCNQYGHFARECNLQNYGTGSLSSSLDNNTFKNHLNHLNFQQNHQNYHHQSMQQYQQQQQTNKNHNNTAYGHQQQSSQSVKIVTFVNPSPQAVNSTPPMLIQQGENFQLLLNKNPAPPTAPNSSSANANVNSNGKQQNQSAQSNKNSHHTSSLYHSSQLHLLTRQQSHPIQLQKSNNSNNANIYQHQQSNYIQSNNSNSNLQSIASHDANKSPSDNVKSRQNSINLNEISIASKYSHSSPASSSSSSSSSSTTSAAAAQAAAAAAAFFYQQTSGNTLNGNNYLNYNQYIFTNSLYSPIAAAAAAALSASQYPHSASYQQQQQQQYFFYDNQHNGNITTNSTIAPNSSQTDVVNNKLIDLEANGEQHKPV